MKRSGKRAVRCKAFMMRERGASYGGDESQAPRKFDLEGRTYEFAKGVRVFVKRLPRTICNIADVKQLVRASASVGANYIEANESLGRKNFIMRVTISRKEAKESRFFLCLLDVNGNAELEEQHCALAQGAEELT